jgi:hypothetical protein
MKFNLYLPDELGERARELPRGVLSFLLQAAVREELERRAAVAETLSDVGTHEVEIEDRDGNVYTGRITGTSIANPYRSDIEVFLTEDERVIVYDVDKLEYHVLDDPVEQLRGWLPDDEDYAAALYAIGEKPVVDL